MVKCFYYFLTALFLTLPQYVILSQSKKIEHYSILPESELFLDGDSTLRKFTSKTNIMELNAQLEKSSPPKKKKIKKGVGESVSEEKRDLKIHQLLFKVKVTDLKSDSETLDDHLVEALKGKQFPYIEANVQVESCKIKEKREDGSLLVEGIVDLTIAGEKRAIPIAAILTYRDGKTTIQGEKQLKMTDFKVDPPSLMLGTIKVKDEINIRFNFVLGLKPST